MQPEAGYVNPAFKDLNMTVQLFDSHTHLDADVFAEDRDEIIARARAAGVDYMLSVGAGYGIQGATRAIALAEQYPFIWASAGVHPHDAKEPLQIEQLREYARHPRVVAIGETGLDFYRDWAPREDQYEWFLAQISLALELKKPLIIHSREAGEECLSELEKEGAAAIGGVFHCYAEDASFAARLREINFLVSFPGSITFKNAGSLRQTIKEIPIEQIMLETDAPYMAPVPYRGKRCESSFLIETAKVLAEIKEISLEECAAVTTQNAVKLFSIPTD